MKSQKSRKPQKRGRRNLDDEDVDMESSSEDEDLDLGSEEDSKMEQKDEDWDDECQKCGKATGNVLCCETCPRVCHFECTGLKKKPLNEWYCLACSIKKTSNVRSIRSNSRR